MAAVTAGGSVLPGRRVDDVRCLPQRAGYLFPEPYLPEFRRYLREQLAQWRQVKHSRLAIAVHHPPRLRGTGRQARLISKVADDGASQARPVKPGVTAGTSIRAARRS